MSIICLPHTTYVSFIYLVSFSTECKMESNFKSNTFVTVCQAVFRFWTESWRNSVGQPASVETYNFGLHRCFWQLTIVVMPDDLHVRREWNHLINGGELESGRLTAVVQHMHKWNRHEKWKYNYNIDTKLEDGEVSLIAKDHCNNAHKAFNEIKCIWTALQRFIKKEKCKTKCYNWKDTRNVK